MRKTIVLSLFLILFAFHLSAQKKTVIIFNYISGAQLKDSLYFDIMKPFAGSNFGEDLNYPNKLVSFIRNGDSCQTVCRYTIEKKQIAFMAEGFGHEMLIIPGDTIKVNVTYKGRAKTLGSNISLPWSYNLEFKGKNEYIYGMLERLSEKYGTLHFGALLQPQRNDSTLTHFFERIDSLYQNREAFVEAYTREHAIPQEYTAMVKQEIKNTYLLDMLRPLTKGFKLSQYPILYVRIIRNAKQNLTYLYHTTAMAHRVAYEYSRVILDTPYSSDGRSDRKLKSFYKLIKTSYKGPVLDHMLTRHLYNYLAVRDLNYLSLDSIFFDYQATCKNAIYLAFINAAYQKYQASDIVKFSFNDALSSTILDKNGTTASIKSLFQKKPVLIICWASWCVPCIKELPAEKKFEKMFGDQIDFIYLSFDRKKEDWDNKVTQLKISGKSYLLNDNFKSGFAGYYRMNSIPAYYAFNGNGKPVDIGLIRPSDSVEFNRFLIGLEKTKLP